MNWFNTFLDSSIGQKVVMALTGLFLMIFLIIHLLGNFQLLAGDGGEAFNKYAYFMTNNPLIKTSSYLLYAAILVHAYKGIRLWLRNKAARGNHRYDVNHKHAGDTASKNMAWFGIVIFIFLLVHLYQFWLQMKLGTLPMLSYKGLDYQVADLYQPVATAFSSLPFVIFYVFCMVIVGLHLWHGFWSTFQTLGLAHKKYTPLIKTVGYAYAFLVPLGFAIIPIWMFIANQ